MADPSMMGLVAPEGAVAVECFGDLYDVQLFDEEYDYMIGCSPSRQAEFMSVRGCSQLALEQLGRERPQQLSVGGRGPRWPDGVVGSMTHCHGYRAAAVVHRGLFTALGIDAEPAEELPMDLTENVAMPIERVQLMRLRDESPEIPWGRVLFSAKESLFKAWSTVMEGWLGFEDVSIEIKRTGALEASIWNGKSIQLEGESISRVRGRWCVDRGFIMTSCWV